MTPDKRAELRSKFMTDYYAFGSDGHRDSVGMALDALLDSLQTVEPLTDVLRGWAKSLRDNNNPGSRVHLVAAELLRRCPAPPPKQKTLGQIAHESVRHSLEWDDLPAGRRAEYEAAAAAVVAAHEASR